MFSTTLSKVIARTPDTHQLELQLPPRGEPHAGNAFLIRGHVIGAGPAAAELRVVANHQPARVWPVEVTGDQNGHRYDLSAVVNLLGAPQQTDITLDLIGDDGWHLPVATIDLQRLRQSAGEDELQGIFVVSLGRSGSTMMMSAFAAHPDLVAYERHPFETRIAQQYARIAKTLTEPADFTDPELEAFSQAGGFRSNAYLRPDGDSIALMDGVLGTSNLTHCSEQVARFYEGYAAQRGKTARGFVEKCLPDARWISLLQDLYPGTRIVVLVRDFRDVYKSVLAFNTRRGFPAFGREAVDTDLDYIDHLAGAAEALIEVAEMPDAVVVRYEDIITDSEKALRNCLEALEMEAGPAALRSMVSALSKDTPEKRRHQTAPSKGASVARWQAESSVAEQHRYMGRLNRPLKVFGYDTEDGLSSLFAPLEVNT